MQVPNRRGTSDWLQNSAWMVIGVLGIPVIWEVVGRFSLAGPAWPPFSSVIDYLTSPEALQVWKNAGITARSGLIGFAICLLLALATCVVTYLLPLLGPGVQQFATMLQATPVIVFGPILLVIVGRETTPILTAAFITFYPLWVNIGVGLGRAQAALQDICTVYGATRPRTLRLVALPQAIPATLDGIKLAIPAAFAGAIVGEWFGSPSGLGVVLLNAMQNFQAVRLWAAALVGAFLTLSLYGVASIAGRLVNRRWLE